MPMYKRKRPSGPATRRVRPRTMPMYRRPRRNLNIVSIKRTVTLASITINNTWTGTNWYGTLNQLPNYTDFTNMFDAYRINGIKYTFIPTYSCLDGNQALANTSHVEVPRMYTAIEKQSNAQLSSEAQMQQYQNLRYIRNPLRPFTVYVKSPAVWEGVQTTASVGYSHPKTRQWISCDTPSVNHYGAVVGGVTGVAGSGVVFQYNVIATFYMQFKEAR